MTMRIVVTGASRGIGLELCRTLLARGARVAAIVREPRPALDLLARGTDRLHVLLADVTSDDDVRAAAAAVDQVLGAMDVLVNNAGINPGRDADLRGLDFQDARAAFEVNALAPLRVTRALLPALGRGERPRVVQVSSRMGSLAENAQGGAWAYRMSKAALNMAHVNLALELRGVAVCVVVHPGWVRTDMGGPSAPLSVEQSAQRLADVIEELGAEDHGGFIDVSGGTLPW